MNHGKVTIQDVAQAAGVSPATVSMILRGRQGVSFSQETRVRVFAEADRLGYRKSASAGNFDRPTVAIFVPLITGSYYTFIAQAITQRANEMEYDTLVLETHRNAERELRLMHSISRMGVSGVIFTAPPINVKAAVELDRIIPTVAVNNRHQDIPLDCVITDDARVGGLVADHLLELGHRDVVFVEISRSWQGIPISQRLIGAQNSFDRYPDARLKVILRPAPNTLRPGSFIETREMARDIAVEAMKDPTVTAFICISDYAAYGVMDALAAAGRSIPEEYSVCACDDLFASNLPGVSLTTVDRHPVEIGCNSFELLLQRIQDDRSGVNQPSRVTRVEYLSNLVVRGSSAAPRRKL